MTDLHKSLLTIQHTLKAPKSQYNSFGKYNYRNCEDILEAVKPIAFDLGCTVRLTDKVVQIGDRYYVEATAGLHDGENSIETVAYAREEQEKKGMDGSQVTGASSSYARKYALNGLFAIDDAKDSDHTKGAEEKKREEQKLPPLTPNTEAWRKSVIALKGEYKIEDIKKKYSLSKENEEKLQSAAREGV